MPATVKLVENGTGPVAPERAEVDVTEPEAEMISSVAPTLQCAGYTGMAYAKISLYDVEEGMADMIKEVGGWLVNELSECVCVIVSPLRSYIMSVNV